MWNGDILYAAPKPAAFERQREGRRLSVAGISTNFGSDGTCMSIKWSPVSCGLKGQADQQKHVHGVELPVLLIRLVEAPFRTAHCPARFRRGFRLDEVHVKADKFRVLFGLFRISRPE